MSKIICDVCGTSYPETSDQCPICGCVRPADVQGVINDSESNEARSGYTYVKGGRFSKANVKKRAKENQKTDYVADYADSEPETAEASEKSGTNKGLVVTVIILVLAILAVAAYIFIRFFGIGQPVEVPTEPSTTVSTTERIVPCTNLSTTVHTIELSEVGSAWMLNMIVEPSDTTDSISYQSSDTTVATVSDKGKITAVGAGQATVTITCGDQTLECRVICDIQETTEATTEETTEETVNTEYTEEDLRLNREDITFSYKGAQWKLYNGKIPVEEITWSVGNEAVATIENGVVTAVGAGKTTVYGKYGDMEVSCIIRCSFSKEDTAITGSDNVTPDG